MCHGLCAVASRREELARTLKSLEIAQRSLEEQTRVSAENAASLRGEAAAASARSADLTDRCSALERERDRALRQIESGAERIQTVLAFPLVSFSLRAGSIVSCHATYPSLRHHELRSAQS